MAPLGYDTQDRKITVNEAEAERVRTIFESYLKLGSLNLVMADLRKRGIVTKVRTLRTGETVGGIAFTRGPLAHLLRNRFYIGEVAFKGEVLAGEQPAIIDRDLFDAVQARLSEQVTNHKVSRTGSEALLLGRIFDDRGHRMSPSHVRKRAIKYRYYLSSALLQGRPKQAGTVSRIPAREVETLIANAVRKHLRQPTEINDTVLINTHVVDEWEAMCRNRISYSFTVLAEPNETMITFVSCRELLATSRMLLHRARSKSKATGCRIR